MDFNFYNINMPGYPEGMIINTIMNNSQDTIYFKDINSKFILNSKAHAMQFGLENPMDLRGKDDYDFFPKEFADMAYATEQEIIRSGKPIIGKVEQWDHMDGTTTWFLASKYPLYNSDGDIIGTWGNSKDITDIKKTEYEIAKVNKELTELTKSQKENLEKLRITQEQLVEKEKMAALGQLVAGVAHEINTPVGICVTTISHIKQKSLKFKKGAESDFTKKEINEFLCYLEDTTEIIAINLERAANLIHSFKQIAVDQSHYKKMVFNLKDYIDTIILSLKHELKHRDHEINILMDYSILLNSFPGVFSQIFTNCIMNTFLHGYAEKEHINIDIEIAIVDGNLQILYKDYGQGIRPAIVEHIFEPFFTTKFGHGGSGLGMSIVYNLVTRKLGGEITCERNKNQGVLFRIVLPYTTLA
jgi:PAS domain S-box-containing protein